MSFGKYSNAQILHHNSTGVSKYMTEHNHIARCPCSKNEIDGNGFGADVRMSANSDLLFSCPTLQSQWERRKKGIQSYKNIFNFGFAQCA